MCCLIIKIYLILFPIIRKLILVELLCAVYFSKELKDSKNIPFLEPTKSDFIFANSKARGMTRPSENVGFGSQDGQ